MQLAVCNRIESVVSFELQRAAKGSTTHGCFGMSHDVYRFFFARWPYAWFTILPELVFHDALRRAFHTRPSSRNKQGHGAQFQHFRRPEHVFFLLLRVPLHLQVKKARRCNWPNQQQSPRRSCFCYHFVRCGNFIPQTQISSLCEFSRSVDCCEVRYHKKPSSKSTPEPSIKQLSRWRRRL